MSAPTKLASTPTEHTGPGDLATKLEPFHPALLFGLGFLVRVWLIHTYPVIFGGDSVVRLANQDRILLAYQLPLLQAVIHYLGYISQDPLLIRYTMAVIGALAGMGFYLLAGSLLGRPIGFYTALFFVANPFLLAFSIVPYQEILMLAGLFYAFYLFFNERPLLAGLALGLACLTRYEAWAACPVFVLACWLRGRRGVTDLAKACLLFGWAPLLWIAYNTGLAPSGSFVLDLHVSIDRLQRYVYLGWITVKNTPLPVLALAFVGAWRFGTQGMIRARRYRMLAAFGALFLIAILFSAHGEREQPERFVTAREAHLPIAATILLAGLGLTRLTGWRTPVVALSVSLGLFMAGRFVAQENAKPHHQLSYQLAHYLDEHVAEHEHVIVLARPIPRDPLEHFLDKATERGGALARRRALQSLAQIDTSPTDYQRTLIHSRLGKDRLLSFATLPLSDADQESYLALGGRMPPPAPPNPRWLAVWSDLEPTNAVEDRLQSIAASAAPIHILRRGTLSVRILYFEAAQGGSVEQKRRAAPVRRFLPLYSGCGKMMIPRNLGSLFHAQ